jgi:hypothetical protein
MHDEHGKGEQRERDEGGQTSGREDVPPEQAVPPAFEPGRENREKSSRDGEASDDLQNDPAYEPEDQGLKGIKGG